MLDASINAAATDQVVAEGSMINAREYHTLAVLANGVEFAKRVVRGVVGDEVAAGFDNELLTETELSNLIAAKLQSHLTSQRQGAIA